MLAGARPFRGRIVEDFRRAHISATPPPLRERAKAPEAFERAVLRALSKDRADRQPTAGDFARELRAALEGCAIASDGTPDESQSEAETARFAESPTSGGTVGTREMTEIVEADLAAVPPEPADAPARDGPPATKARPRTTLWIGATTAVVMAVALVLFLWMPCVPDGLPPPEPPSELPPQDGATALRFYVAFEDGDRASGLGPLPRERSFRLHFAAEADGSLYLLERTETGFKTLLTAVPDARSGHAANTLRTGQDFEFPRGASASLGFGESDVVTLVVIFSPEPLQSPSALAKSPGRALTGDETRELDALIAASARAPAVRMAEDAPHAATVVSVPSGILGRHRVALEIPLRAAPPNPRERQRS
jgi:hypothetical protein